MEKADWFSLFLEPFLFSNVKQDMRKSAFRGGTVGYSTKYCAEQNTFGVLKSKNYWLLFLLAFGKSRHSLINWFEKQFLHKLT